MWRGLRSLVDHAGPILLVVLMVLVGGAWNDLKQVQQRLVEQNSLLDRVLGKVGRMTTFTTTWRSDGVEHSVSTTCREGESMADCLRRHEDAVAAMQEIHPPDPPR